jgi:antitoxin component YwqK of YwqJK toxin-antitoxin module
MSERIEHDDAGRVSRRYHTDAEEQLEGECTTWDAEGWLAQRAQFKAGLLDGELVQYDPEGNVSARVSYRAGKLHGEALFYERRRPQLKTQWRDGLQDGESIVYSAEGRPSARAEYRSGKLHGRSSWYRPNGTLMRTLDYIDGEPADEPVEYDERGRALERRRA